MLENRLSDIPRLIENAHHQQKEVFASRIDAETALARPFAHSDALTRARAELERIDEQLATLATDDDGQAQEHAPDDARAVPIQDHITHLQDAVTHTAAAVQQLERIRALASPPESPRTAIPDADQTMSQHRSGPNL